MTPKTLHIPVFDMEYAVIGRWKTEVVEVTLTRKGNFKYIDGMRNVWVFDKTTGKCLNRRPREYMVNLVERMRYTSIMPHLDTENKDSDDTK